MSDGDVTAAPSRSNAVLLSNAAARRVSNQIARAFRGTYGAETGLRTIVRSIALPLLASGASTDAVVAVFEACVLSHSARAAADAPNRATIDARSAAIIAVARDGVADAAAEVARLESRDRPRHTSQSVEPPR